MLTFPTGYFCPPGMTLDLVGASESQGASLSGISQYAMTSGGGLWTMTFAETPLWTRDRYNLWSAISRATDQGATPFVVPICDRRSQPFTDPKRGPGVGNSDDSKFADGATWAAELITASIVGAAPLRATSLKLAVAGGRELQGGERFTVWHGTKGQRLYEVVRVTQRIDSTHFVVDVRPPLREATADGVAADFDNPRCQMRLDGSMAATLQMLRLGKSPTVKFVEDFRPAWLY